MWGRSYSEEDLDKSPPYFCQAPDRHLELRNGFCFENGETEIEEPVNCSEDGGDYFAVCVFIPSDMAHVTVWKSSSHFLAHACMPYLIVTCMYLYEEPHNEKVSYNDTQ